MKLDLTCSCGEPLVEGRPGGREFDATLECETCDAQFIITLTQVATPDKQLVVDDTEPEAIETGNSRTVYRQ